MKMSSLKHILTALAVAVLSAGCNPGGQLKEEFMETEDLGLTVGYYSILKYDPLTHQLCYNESRNEFRITDDTMANYFIITCYDSPSSNSSVKADIIYTTDSDTKRKEGITFEVTKMDDSGKIWLWNNKNRIGAVVQILH